MTTHKKALMLAREYVLTHSIDAGEVFIAIEEALAGAECDQQPEQEPVGFAVMQKPWVGLTNDEVYESYLVDTNMSKEKDWMLMFYEAIEARLKEKNA